MNQITEDDIDCALQAIYDFIDSDDHTMASIVEFVHEHRKEAAAFVNERMGK